MLQGSSVWHAFYNNAFFCRLLFRELTYYHERYQRVLILWMISSSHVLTTGFDPGYGTYDSIIKTVTVNSLPLRIRQCDLHIYWAILV